MTPQANCRLLAVFSLAVLAVTVQADTEVADCKGKPADIVFVLDESGSIWGPDFDRQKEFVQDMVDIFDIGPYRQRVSVLTFSDKPLNRFYLNEHNTREDLKAAVHAIQQRRGGTKTFNAIKAMREQNFSPRLGARSGVARIAIVVTDGESENKTETIRQAKLAKDMGIVIFAIGVGFGKRFKPEEVMGIASEPLKTYYQKLEGYKNLDKIKESLAIRTCEVSTTPPPTTTTTTPTTTTTLPQMIEGCRGLYTIDAVFSLSERTGSRENNLAIDFIKSLAAGATISPEKVQFGLGPTICKKTDKIKLNDCGNQKTLLKTLEAHKTKLGSNPEIAMEQLYSQSFATSEGGRADSVKFGIVIIDDRLADPEKVLDASEKARDVMQLVVISVGDDVKEHEDVMREAAYSSSHYFHVKDYASLTTLKHKIEELFCNGVKNGLRQNVEF